ncbi:nucleotidyltransferase domain-containing protein [Candidatus Gottesmanbacteria bacterium]|nr:nucleotidyltransferase domain-containing protein [Candidatus Gottesmanbacteria bacterium]
MNDAVITSKQKELIQKIVLKHGLDFVVFYGSLARQVHVSRDADIDLGLYRRGGIDADEYLALSFELQKVFFGKALDIKLLHDVDPLFRFEVMKNGILIAGNTEKFQEYYLYAYRDYQEAQPLYVLMKRMQEKRQKKLENIYDKQGASAN